MNKTTKRILFEVGKDSLVFILVTSLIVTITDSVFLPVIIGLLTYLCCLSTITSLARIILEDTDKLQSLPTTTIKEEN